MTALRGISCVSPMGTGVIRDLSVIGFPTVRYTGTHFKDLESELDQSSLIEAPLMEDLQGTPLISASSHR